MPTRLELVVYLLNVTLLFLSANDLRAASVTDRDGDRSASSPAATESPSVLSVAPRQNEISAPHNTRISAQFDEDMLEPTGDDFVVHGAFSGRVEGNYAAGSSRDLTFNTAPNFLAGESVEVSLTKRIEGQGGLPLSLPFVWRFLTATGSGPAEFNIRRHDFGSGDDETTALAAGRVNLDGTIDLVVGNYGGGVVVYLNEGGYAWASSGVVVGAADANIQSVRLSDVDGDSNLDIVAVTSEAADASGKVFFNNGVGQYPSSSTWGQGNGRGKIEMGDMDADGDLDIVFARWGEPGLVCLNDGLGQFGEIREFGTASDSSNDLSLGDIDGDGDLDAVVAHSNHSDRVYLNAGDGTLAEYGTLGDAETPTECLRLGDFDGDGDLDVVCGYFQRQSRIYFNDGSGQFTEGSPFGPEFEHTTSLECGDLDGDGDLDIAAAMYSYTEVFLNDGGCARIERSNLRARRLP